MEGRGVGKWEAIFKFRKACMCIGREKKRKPGKLGQETRCLLERVGRELMSW